MLPTARPAAIRRWLPLTVSVLAVGVALALTDLHGLRDLTWRTQWDRLPSIMFFVAAIVVAFAWRWRTLLIEGLTMSRSLEVAALGLGGNQLLPLRGGDAVRVVISSRGAGAPSIHSGVSAIAIEKLFDLIAVAAFGLASAARILESDQGELNVMAIAVAILLIVIVTLVTARSVLLIRTIRYLSRAIRLSPRLYRHVLRPLVHLRQSTTPARTAILLLQTAFIWLVLYVLAYLAIAQLIGVELRLTDVMVLLFAGAIGVAIPAAPSGIGTFHAAIVSAFILLGKPASEGLVLAIAIHAVFFIGLCASAAFALLLASHRSALRMREGSS
ncbi:MAG: lysylphosphatidylglycerol synthase transmembrane domain-containing protein [Burkholderiaceae bacterium]